MGNGPNPGLKFIKFTVGLLHNEAEKSLLQQNTIFEIKLR
jgi:hypothetical protein